ncbi:MAG TPA: Ldh family oxidoreductase [Devosia sp.]|jgi:LDH2 family malate/lactate/ureidoglycolate dehydrogenase|uniref:Ldh family oxidoreductase n=1 Tax=Devosia sp. TaxID=1871048 RepID=UPI002DDDB84E|nr:Ldh family oxidoreductase [Devosia sp.]HEV2516057.1 Ldh family oxidoreductase [Devosia sp.]
MIDRAEDLSVPHQVLDRFISDALVSAGSAAAPADAVARALSSASLRGIDSHGVRLLPHYIKVLKGGRITADPQLSVERLLGSTAIVDADDGFGHYASYQAIAEGCTIAKVSGIAAVSVVNSSHFGAAGCYALEAAEQGLVAFAFSNSDSFVLPHDGVVPFHGTNPIAFAAPVGGSRPYLVDMATSIVPWNRIQDYRSKGMRVPPDVAVDATGQVTADPAQVAALLPIGGESHGFKGAALASMMEVLSAVMTGMAHCSRLLPMVGADMSTPRRLGHFFIVINPEAFVARAAYDAGMASYLLDIRSSPARPGATVMAPGDREWACADRRAVSGIPMSASLVAEYFDIAREYGLDVTELQGREAS